MGQLGLSCGLQTLSKRGLGLLLIFATALIWVVASFISELLVTTKPGEKSLHVPPLLLTYLATSVFTFFLPIAYGRAWLQDRWSRRQAVQYQRLDAAEADAEAADGSGASPNRAPAAAAARDGNEGDEEEDDFATSLERELEAAEAAAAVLADSSDRKAAQREAMIAGAQCCFLWFIAQFFFNLSLAWTSVTSNTILSSSSSLFTFALSMLFLKEGYSLSKLLSILLCMGGTILVTLSDRDAAMDSSKDHSAAGDLLCLVSAAFYASYVVVLRKALPDEGEANVLLFFGFVGLFCTIAVAPIVVGLAASGMMDLKQIPPEAYGIIAIEGVLNYAFSDYLWAHAVLLLGPTIATLGLSVQIPIAAFAEAMWGHPKWLASGYTIGMTVGGTLLILLGFFWGNLAGHGEVPGSHHRHEGHAGERRYLAAAGDDDDDWNAAFEEGGDEEEFAIPVSTRGGIRGRVSLPGRSSSHTHAAGDLPVSSPASRGSKGQQPEGAGSRSYHQQQQQQSSGLELTSISLGNGQRAQPLGPRVGSGSSISSSGSSSSGRSNSEEGDGSVAVAEGLGAAAKKVHRVSRLARASSYLDAA